jgi:hydroxymethylbilane synthase
MVASLDGQRLIRDQVSGTPDTAEQLGIELAGKLREQGAKEILDEILATLDRS